MADLTAYIRFSGLGKSQDFSKTISSNSVLLLLDEETVATGVTDREFAVAEIDASAMQFLWIYSDQDITIETNSGSAADDTITVTGGEGILWYTNSPFTNPITTDVTGSIFVTNASGATATITIVVGQDPSPA